MLFSEKLLEQELFGKPSTELSAADNRDYVALTQSHITNI